jgi:stage V sporulation protein B
MIMNIDLLIIKHYFPGDASLGYYNGAINLAKIPYFAFFAFSMTILPLVSDRLRANDHSGAKDVIQTNLSSLLVMAIPLIFIVFAEADGLLDFVYPSEYVMASTSLRLLFTSMCGLALMQALNAAIIATGRTGMSMCVFLACAMVQIGLNVWLTPQFGINGAAAANLSAVLVSLIAFVPVVHRDFGFPIKVGQILKSLIASLVMYFLIRVWGPDQAVWAPLTCMAGFVLYGLIMVIIDSDSRDMAARLTRRLRNIAG